MLKNISLSNSSRRLLPNALQRHLPTQPPGSEPTKASSSCEFGGPLRIGLPAAFHILGGLQFKNNQYSKDDSFVINSRLRQAVINKIAKEPGVKEAYWRETAGVIELGAGYGTSIPIVDLPTAGFGFSVDFGFEPSALLAYRYSRPARVYEDSEKDQVPNDNFALFPSSVEAAMKLPLGHEVELCGTGKLNVCEGITLTEGVGINGICKIGVSAAMATTQTVLGEYGLSVLALDGQNQVRVTIRKTNQNIQGMSLDLRAGVVSMLPVPLPSFGNGAIPTLVHDGSASLLSSLAYNFGSIVFHAGNDRSEKNSIITAYDIDLSKSEGQKAYYELLRLNPGPANQLAKEPGSGLSKVILKEREQSNTNTISFTALNLPLFSKESANINNKGNVGYENGPKILYHDRIYKENFNSLIIGNRAIEWDGITVKDIVGDFHTYYRFNYTEKNKISKQDYVDRHCHLAAGLGISPATLQKNKLIEMNDFIKVFSDADNIATNIEFFFTEEGVERLMNATIEDGVLAFLRSNIDMNLSEDQLKRAYQAFVRYQNLEQSWWPNFTKTAQFESIKNDYQALSGRDLAADYASLEKAQDFGKLIGKFCHAHDVNKARDFFALLGERGDMDYTEILLAVTALTGRKNLLVHELSLKGGGVAIKCNDEGQIHHPRSDYNLFSRNEGLRA